MTENGRRRLDTRTVAARREAERRASGTTGARCAILRMVVRRTMLAVRPDDVSTALPRVADLAPPSPSLVTRPAQGLPDVVTGGLTGPLAPGWEPRDGADLATGSRGSRPGPPPMTSSALSRMASAKEPVSPAGMAGRIPPTSVGAAGCARDMNACAPRHRRRIDDVLLRGTERLENEPTAPGGLTGDRPDARERADRRRHRRRHRSRNRTNRVARHGDGGQAPPRAT